LISRRSPQESRCGTITIVFDIPKCGTTPHLPQFYSAVGPGDAKSQNTAVEHHISYCSAYRPSGENYDDRAIQRTHLNSNERRAIHKPLTD
jgi:hypothetical protein